MQVSMEMEDKHHTIECNELKVITKAKYNNQGWATSAMDNRLVYHFNCEFVSMEDNHIYISKKHLKMLYGMLVHDHQTNVAQEMYMLAKSQMEKHPRDTWSSVAIYWQSLYNQKA